MLRDDRDPTTPGSARYFPTGDGTAIPLDAFFQSLFDQFAGLSTRKRRLLALGLLLVLVVTALAVGRWLPDPVDWSRTYRPAALKLASGRSPYEVSSFHNPPWILIPLIPIAALPSKVGNGVLFVVTLSAVVFVAIRMGAKPISLLALIASFPVLFLLLFGQIDWLILLGTLLPPQLGLFLVLTKPQAGLGIAVFWLVASLRRGGLREALRVFAPVTLLFLLSMALFSTGFLNTPLILVPTKHNMSLWPFSIPIGLGLLAVALRNRDFKLSMMSSPFLSPYVSPHTWTIALLPLVRWQGVAILASLASWSILLVELSR